MPELKKSDSGRAIRNAPKIGESLALIDLNKYVSIIISAIEAPVRVTKNIIAQTKSSFSEITEINIVERPIIPKPIAIIVFSPNLRSEILPNGYSNKTNGKSMMTKIMPISFQSKPMTLLR